MTINDSTSNYIFVNPLATTSTTDCTTDSMPWSTIRIPKIEIQPWTHVEPPRPGGIIDSRHLTEPIENLRKEFDMKLEGMMNQIMERVIQMVLLMPRRKGMSEIPIREGVWCICGNFIPEHKKLERCEYCGK